MVADDVIKNFRSICTQSTIVSTATSTLTFSPDLGRPPWRAARSHQRRAELATW
jgi:hypothetical protein